MDSDQSRGGGTRRQKLAILLALTATLAWAARGAAEDKIDPMAVAVGQRFTMSEQSFVALADAMPAERYGFKPTDGAFLDARTFGEQVKHVACANFAFFNQIEKQEPPADRATGGPDSKGALGEGEGVRL
jgi:hypothetical protein